MTASRLFFYFSWFVPPVLQLSIAIILVRRKMVSEFPAFFVYTCFQILQFAVLFTMDAMDSVSRDQFMAAWLVERYSSAGLRFAVIHEIFHHVFRSYPALQSLGGRLLRWSIVLLMILAVVLVASSTGTGLNRESLVIIVIDRAVDIMQVGLLVVLLVLVRYLRLTWSTYVLPIAVGLGLYSSAMLVMAALHAHYGMFYQPALFGLIEHVVYGCSALIWFTALLIPERAVRPVKPPLAPELETWNAALQRLLQQ
jgi:hypothetical protein